MSNSRLGKSSTTASGRSTANEAPKIGSQDSADHPHFSPDYKRFRDIKLGILKQVGLSEKKNEAEMSKAKRDRNQEGTSLATLASDPYLNDADDEGETGTELSRKRKLVPAKVGVKKRRTDSDSVSFSVDKTKLAQFLSSQSRPRRRRSSVVTSLPYAPAQTPACSLLPSAPSPIPPSSGHPPLSAPLSAPPPSAPSSVPLPQTHNTATFSGGKRKKFFYRTPDSLQSLFQTSISNRKTNFDSYKAGVVRPEDGDEKSFGDGGCGGREVGNVSSDDAAEARSTLSSASKKRKLDVDQSWSNKTHGGKNIDTAIARTSTENNDYSSDCENAASAKKLKAKTRIQQSLEKTMRKKKLEVLNRKDKGNGPKTIDFVNVDDRISFEPSTSAQKNAVDVVQDDCVVENNDQVLYNDNDTHCPICFSKGILTQLTHCFIDIDDMISVCPQSGCSYPIGLAVTTVKSAVSVVFSSQYTPVHNISC